jgi:hypothetical protein
VEHSRDELIELLMWHEGGDGFAGNIALSMAWALDQPGPERPDLQSIVSIKGPPEKYTDEELRTLLEFSQRRTSRYDEMFTVRRGANLILFDKPEYLGGVWKRKRLTWTHGPMTSPTLEEAIAAMERN